MLSYSSIMGPPKHAMCLSLLVGLGGTGVLRQGELAHARLLRWSVKAG